MPNPDEMSKYQPDINPEKLRLVRDLMTNKVKPLAEEIKRLEGMQQIVQRHLGQVDMKVAGTVTMAVIEFPWLETVLDVLDAEVSDGKLASADIHNIAIERDDGNGTTWRATIYYTPEHERKEF